VVGGGEMIKRYEVCEQNGNEYEIENGRFILYENYKQLQKENEKLKKEIDRLNKLGDEIADRFLLNEMEEKRLYKEIEQLKKEIQRLNDYIEDKDNRINHPLKCNCKFWEEDNNE